MALGSPSITTPNALDLRVLQTAIQNIRQRIEAAEAVIGTTSSTVRAQANSQNSSGSFGALLAQLTTLALRVSALENTNSTDIESFLAGETITLGQGVVPIDALSVGAADPSDPTRILGLLGVAINAASTGAMVQVQRRGVYAPPGVSGLLVDRAVYVDGTGITQTPGSNDATALLLGIAVSSTQIYVDPSVPVVLATAFDSNFPDSYTDFLPAAYRLVRELGSLEALIDALPANSGVDPHAQVPVTIDGVAVRVNAADIAALASGALPVIVDGDLLANTSGGTAQPVGTTLSDYLDYVFGITDGALLYRAYGSWLTLPPGALSYVLTSTGSDIDWAPPPGGSLPSIADGDVLANISGSVMQPIGVVFSDYLDYVFGVSHGALLYRAYGSWVVLPPGTSSYVLTSTGADIGWAPGSGGGGSATDASLFWMSI